MGRKNTTLMTIGQILHTISNGAMTPIGKIQVMNDTKGPKFCAKCKSLKTYTKKQRYQLASGEWKVSEKTFNAWYKYGKYGYLCEKCYLKQWDDRRVQEEALRKGYMLQVEAI